MSLSHSQSTLQISTYMETHEQYLKGTINLAQNEILYSLL